MNNIMIMCTEKSQCAELVIVVAQLVCRLWAYQMIVIRTPNRPIRRNYR